jgi:hypothetical protein
MVSPAYRLKALPFASMMNAHRMVPFVSLRLPQQQVQRYSRDEEVHLEEEAGEAVSCPSSNPS